MPVFSLFSLSVWLIFTVSPKLTNLIVLFLLSSFHAFLPCTECVRLASPNVGSKMGWKNIRIRLGELPMRKNGEV